MKTLLSLIATAGLVGCVGGIDEPPVVTDPLDTPDGDGNQNGDNPVGADLTEAKALYDSGVYGTVKAKCTSGACHLENQIGGSVSKFVSVEPTRGWQTATNYSAVVGIYDAASAPILTKIAPANHYSVTYTPAEIAGITTWLNKEIELRNGQPGGTDPVTTTETLGAAAERVIQQFAGCMHIDDFRQANMADAWGNMGSDEGDCVQCHENGGEGFIATDQETKFFQRLTKNKWEFLMYFTPDLTMGATGAKMQENRASFYGVAEGRDPHREHPRFNAGDDSQGIIALKSFYELTQLRVAAGGCAPGNLQTH